MTTVNATEPQPPLDSKILILIQDLVNDRLVGSGDAMDIDTSDSPTIADLNRIQSSLEKLAKTTEEGNASSTTASRALVNTLVNTTSNDVLKILETVKQIQNTKQAPTDNSNASDTAASDAAEQNAEFTLLQCTEEFPDDVTESDGSSYYKNLDKKTTMYTSAGNSNDPLVKNLICEEKGFFEGDDEESVDKEEKGKGDAAASVERSRQLALILETTQSVRAKTLELAKRRLKRQRVE